MQIQVNTDSNVQGDDSLAGWVRQELEEKLARFRPCMALPRSW